MIVWIIGIVVLTVYVLSVIWCRHETKVYYSEYDNVYPDLSDVIFTFVPVINLIIAITDASANGLGKKIVSKFYGYKGR